MIDTYIKFDLTLKESKILLTLYHLINEKSQFMSKINIIFLEI